MPKIAYIEKRFHRESWNNIHRACDIIEEYEKAGFSLTLRQLYYQFVAREFIPNNQKSYKRLGSLIDDARLAGHIDWNAIEDRTRYCRSNSHWDGPEDVINSAAQGYGIDLWEQQPTRVEVWIEKDALVGVIERVCRKWDVPFFSCRGYTSQSEMWRAAQRHISYHSEVMVLHLGDHDPSGIDMSRDIATRLCMFDAPTRVQRIALNMDQVKQYKLPPNPAKMTDSRFADYKRQHGSQSWELDALEPQKIETMVDTSIAEIVSLKMWNKQHRLQELQREDVRAVAEDWHSVKAFLRENRE